MKDRWKILWICVAFTIIVGITVGSITASFKKVQLQQYGILYYKVYDKVTNQPARDNGNYLIGFDYDFYKFPSNIISIPFNTSTFTKDMSTIDIQGLFAGRLIMDQVMSMYENYGFEYLEFLKTSVQQYTRQTIQNFFLTDLIGDRSEIQKSIQNTVCMGIQNQYSWIICDYISLGNIGTNIPQPQYLQIDSSYQQKQIDLLTKQINVSKKINFYNSGGKQFISHLQRLNAQLFQEISSKITSDSAPFPCINSGSTTTIPTSDIASMMRYLIQSANFPPLNNNIKLKI